MSQVVSIGNDLKTAGVLAGSTGLLGAVSVPLLLPSIFELIPPEQRTLPLPLPLFCVVLTTFAPDCSISTVTEPAVACAGNCLLILPAEMMVEERVFKIAVGT